MAIGAVTVVGLALSACGSSSNSDKTAGPSAATVYAKYGQMSPAQRDPELAKIAKQEGALTVYTDLSTGDKYVAPFEKQYNIKVKVYDPDSDTLLQKVLQEEGAHHPDADVFDAEYPYVTAVDQKGYLAQNWKFADTYNAQSVSPGWTTTRYIAFASVWNTQTLKDNQVPSSIEDLANPKWKGKIAIDLEDSDWYAAVITYLEGKGMSEADAESTFKKIAANATIAKGHSTIGTQIASGEKALSPDNYVQTVTKLAPAPLAWHLSDRAVQPVVQSPCGVGLLKDALHPAAAMLFADWELSQAGQKSVLAQGGTPVDPALSQLTPYKPILPPIKDLLDSTKYQDQYKAIVGG
jgi:iron(III) transport system substrate-binding protein